MRPETGEIPVITVRGSHREVGRQIGSTCADAVRTAVGFEDLDMSASGRTMAEQLRLAGQYREITRNHMPWLVEELDGVAEGALVDPLRLFAASTEEIWAPRGHTPPSTSRGASTLTSPRGRCTDLVAGPPATAQGEILVAHNNDLDAAVQPSITAVEWNVDGEARIFSIGVGPWISVGWNDRGLSVTGNEVQPNDTRPGIPRLLLVRAQLREASLCAARNAALHPARASAYNTVFAHRDGDVLDIEGSATDHAEIHLSPSGVLTHTNHYVCTHMLDYEGDIDYAARSAIRHRRAAALMDEATRAPGSVDSASMLAMLADHENMPDSLCRHPSEHTTTKTVFWCIADVTSGAITFGLGNPCVSSPQTYRFAA
jgi:isopenicillin-N N-acyltransferase-like protein